MSACPLQSVLADFEDACKSLDDKDAIREIMLVADSLRLGGAILGKDKIKNKKKTIDLKIKFLEAMRTHFYSTYIYRPIPKHVGTAASWKTFIRSCKQ